MMEEYIIKYGVLMDDAIYMGHTEIFEEELKDIGYVKILGEYDSNTAAIFEGNGKRVILVKDFEKAKIMILIVRRMSGVYNYSKWQNKKAIREAVYYGLSESNQS